MSLVISHAQESTRSMTSHMPEKLTKGILTVTEVTRGVCFSSNISDMAVIVLRSVLFLAVLNIYLHQSLGASKLPVVLNTWSFTLASDTGFETLMKGGSAVDGIVSGITACELKPCANNPLNPNVGFGGKPNEVGETTLDALIMNGVGHQSGAVGCLRRVKNAIGVARAVMNYTKHSLLIGDDATNFAKEFGFPEESLTTNNSRKVWEDWKSNKCQPNFWKNLPGDPQSGCRPYSFPDTQSRKRREVAEDNHDTIGMVAVDANGNVAAGCSTNGLGFKIPGRVGDSPIAGAGAYADNDVGAAAATGNGDIMAKYLPTYQTVEFMRQGFSPEKAAEMALMRIHKIYKDGFTGSVIAVNKKGEYGAASYKWTSFKYSVRNPALGKSVVGDKAPFDPARAAREPACGPTSGAVSSTVKIFCVGLFSIVVMSVL